MISEFTDHPKIWILNPQTRYFHQNVKSTIFENGHFWECDVENWLFEKMVWWIWLICCILVKIVHTQLFITSNHQNRPYRPIYQKSQKKYHIKKILFFIENWLWRRQNGSNRKTWLVPSTHKHSPQTHKYHFSIREYVIFTCIFRHQFSHNSQGKYK